MKRASLGILAIMLALAACKEPRTEIVVTVDSNLTIPDEFDQVRIVVTGETSSQRFDQTYDLGPTETKLPIVLGLVPDSDEKLAFRVVATGLSNSVGVVERAATTTFVPDQTLSLYLDLLRVCVRATCQSGETCGPQGTCMPESIKPADLPKYGTVRDAGTGAGQVDGGLAPDGAVADARDGTGTILDSGTLADHPADDVGLDVADVAPSALDTNPTVTPDAPSTKLDALPGVLDTSPATPDTMPDAAPVVPDANPVPDTAPACPTITVQLPPGSGEFTKPSATVQATSTDGFCFKTCDAFYGVEWHSFTGRTITVNGTTLVLFSTLKGTFCGSSVCAGDLSEGGVVGPTLPAAVNGVYTFQISAGTSASASFMWSGGSVACPASGPDASPAIPDAAPVLSDTSPPPDTTPAIPCDKLGATGIGSMTIPLPTTAYCFKLCFALPDAGVDSDGDGVSDLSEYGWTCTGFTDVDRTITINGQQVWCSGHPMPAEVDGGYTFVLSAGGHSGDYISWAGELRACP